jgi:hypothetical protein
MSAARAASDAILALRSRKASVRSLQEWHQDGAAARGLAGNADPGEPADLRSSDANRPGGGIRATPRMAPREAST